MEGLNARPGGLNDTWTDDQVYRSKFHEVPEVTTRWPHSETGGDVIEPTHSTLYLLYYVYVYITLDAGVS